MAAPFVPFQFPADWTGVSRCRARRGSPIHTASSIEPSPPESISQLRGVRPWDAAVDAPTGHDSWSRPKGGLSDGSSTLLEGEGSHKDNRIERPIIPILLGYEILEERSKFTLKELFPSIGLALPPKHWFKNNYDEEFLEERQIGLQTFLQKLTLHRDIISSEAVKHFLCLAEPLSPFDSLEESRAFCETLEDTNHRLQRELLESQSEVDALKKTLEEKENHISLLMKKVKSGIYLMNVTSDLSTDLNIIIISSSMRKITGKHLLCFFLLAFPLSWAEDTKKDARKTENDTVWSQVKTRRLFARRKISPPQENHIPVQSYDPCTPLWTPDGKLLLSHSVLRPLRFLPLSTLQHHLPLLEDAVLKEDVDEVQTHMHRHSPARGLIQ
ncbi:Sorting nexin-16 [Nibea albiflora]|uniref:Sorting nexin-16 n=1 Tax=Nibea albiflora TaxID=240163 RepID=A0ACB7FHK5_NIBAL|nr:Sorting nexin-16 [Nibea albiflora]